MLKRPLLVGSLAIAALAGGCFFPPTDPDPDPDPVVVAVDDAYEATEDTPATFSVLDNDSPGAVLSLVTQPTNGTATIAGSVIQYQPDADYCTFPEADPDTFTYTLVGGSTAQVQVTVACVSDFPVLTLPVTAVLVANGATERALCQGFALSDPNGDDYSAVRISFEAGQQTGDYLSASPGPNFSPTGSHSPTNLSYQVNGATEAEIVALLESAQLHNDSGLTAGTRMISYWVTDDTGHSSEQICNAIVGSPL